MSAVPSISIVTLAIVGGAAWRRWWGSSRPSWAPDGYRAAQAIVGAAVPAALAWMAIGPAGFVGIIQGAAIGASCLLILMLPMSWLDPIFTGWRWPVSAIPLAAALYWPTGSIAAVLALPLAALAGFSWLIWVHLWPSRYTVVSECCCGALMFGGTAALLSIR